jgi:predicted dehydrogenase
VSRVVAIAARERARAEEVAREQGIDTVHDTYEALLADKNVDAVYLPLPNPLHVEWSIRAMEAGKHVLVEKPVAMNAAEAAKLIPVRDRMGVVIEEGFPFVNHPQWHFIQQAIAKGEIGDVRSVSATMAFNNLDPNNLRNRPDQGGGGLLDAGCYLINAARIIFRQEPVRGIALFDMDPNFGTDRLTSMILEFPGGHASLTTATQAGPTTGGSHQHLGILGTAGWMRANFPLSHSTASPCSIFIGGPSALGGLHTREEQFPAVNQYQLQAERFSRLVLGENVPAWPIENGVNNMKVIDALFRSGQSRTWEKV